MSIKRVYVAAASAEIDRAMSMIGQVSISSGLSITHDWTKNFTDPAASKVSEAELDARLRRRFFEECIRAVRNSDFVWFLAPGRRPALNEAVASLYATKGAWGELVAAYIYERLHGKPLILVSGAERYQSIFTECAHYFFERDIDALEWLRAEAAR